MNGPRCITPGRALIFVESVTRGNSSIRSTLMKYAGAADLSILLYGGFSSRISRASSSAASSGERVTRVSIL